MQLFVLELGAFSPEMLTRMQKKLPPVRLAQVERCRRDTERAAKTAGFFLLHYAAARMGISLPFADWQYEAGGKPVLCGTPLHFSLSHTETTVALAASVSHPVGIDIEEIRPHAEGFAGKYFSISEQALLAESREKDTLLTQLWCAKEAHAKRTGTGLIGSIADIPSDNTTLLTLELDGKPHALAVSPAGSVIPQLVSPSLLEAFL